MEPPDEEKSAEERYWEEDDEEYAAFERCKSDIGQFSRDRQETIISLLIDALGISTAPLSIGCPRITADSQVCRGKPCVRGLPIPVALVLKQLAVGQSTQQIVSAYPELEADDIAECLRYAAWLAEGRIV